jgi:hypothetical protein
MSDRGRRIVGWLAAIVLLVGQASAAELRPGHLVAVGRENAGDLFSTVYQIDPVSGATETVFSGQSLGFFGGIAIHSLSMISVQRFGAGGKIFTIDLKSGEIREYPLSIYAQGGLRLGRDGSFLTAGLSTVVSPLGDRRAPSVVVRVDRATGEETVVSSAGALFPIGAFTTDLCGDVIVGNRAQGHGSLLRVSVKSGKQIVVPTEFPFDATEGGVAITRTNEILALVPFENSATRLALVKINPVSGKIQVVTEFDSRPSFPKLTVGGDGQIYVTAYAPPVRQEPRVPALFRVDPVTGAQAIVATGNRFVDIGTLETIPLLSDVKRGWEQRCNRSRWHQYFDYLNAFGPKEG